MHNHRLRRVLVAAALGCVVVGGAATTALAGSKQQSSTSSTVGSETQDPGVEHLHFTTGNLDIRPGQNQIRTNATRVPQPKQAGWVVGFKPNVKLANGKVPPVDVLHLHHGVWASRARSDPTSPIWPERFIAAGEEKTALELPEGYGYRYQPSDFWYLNYMIHNLTAKPFKVQITYDVDFVPATSPAAATMKDVHPLWLDVQNGSIYPVFDVLKGSGTNGKFTYPDDDPSAPRINSYTLPQGGVLVKTFGHLHPGGLYDTFTVTRGGQTKTVFTSKAKYYEPAGAVSWDVSMTTTPNDWAVAVKPGDTLGITTTYDSSRASWYESMGLGVVWMYDGTGGTDPFTGKIDQRGVLTHGHLPENNNHGGLPTTLANPTTAASGPLTNAINIGSFEYSAGDLSAQGKVPTVTAGQSITFDNLDGPDQSVWHSVTSCKQPCTKSTGVAYPLADADVQFDSGQLGTGGAPSVGRDTWTTPADLTPGTYTYFCRIHPFMRGAFRVVSATPSG